MDIAKYLSNTATSQNGQYPLTIQGLEFIQRQLLLLHTFNQIGGESYIIKEPQIDNNGLAVIAGEILPIVGIKPVGATHLTILETKESITTDAGVYQDVRIIRTAQYAIKSDVNYKDAKNHPLSVFQIFKTNTILTSDVNTILSRPDSIYQYASVYPSSVDIDGLKSVGRYYCLDGSFPFRGTMTSYIIEVIKGTDSKIVQQRLIGSTRQVWMRDLNTDQTWSDWYAVGDQLTLDIKMIDGKIFVRHGYLPPNAKIVLLRKKRRGKNAGAGEPERSKKTGYYHGWSITLTLGQPNKWYAPKVKSGYFVSHLIQKDLSEALDELLFYSGQAIKPSPNLPPVWQKHWRIIGVNRKWTNVKYAFASLGLAIVQTDSARVPITPSYSVRFKYSCRELSVGNVSRLFHVK